MKFLRRLIPSMFYRRLLLLLLLVLLSIGVISAQLIRLTVVEHKQHLKVAESVLSTQKLIPTLRGRILDRKGRELARQEVCFDVAVRYDVISGDWAFKEAVKEARKAMGRTRWGELSFDEREKLIQSYIDKHANRVETLWAWLSEITDTDRTELDRRVNAVTRRVQMIRAHVIDRRARRREQLSDKPVALEDVVVKVREENQAHTLIAAVPDSVAMIIRKHVDNFPGLKLIDSKTRTYPMQHATVVIDRTTFPLHLQSDEPLTVDIEYLGKQIIGSLRDVWAEDVTESKGGRPYRRKDGSIDLGGYLPGDHVGKRGIELSAEQQLRGQRGLIKTQLDTGDKTITDPNAGHDVTLTLDIRLQARIRALMDPKVGLMSVQDWHKNENMPIGSPLNGGAIVMEVDSGHIVAMVSSPAVPFSGVRDEKNKDEWPTKWDYPGLIRPLATINPPGSTLKPIVYAIAASRNKITTDQIITCKGHLYEKSPGRFRCWGWRPLQGKYLKHGPLGPVEAIGRSCNIYFYTCGHRVGARDLIESLQQWGYGKRTGIGLTSELPGVMPLLDRPNQPGRELSKNNATLMGIGQGPISATMVQVVAAHCALARGGYWLSPVLMKYRQADQTGRDLHLQPRVVENALKGMWTSANESFGTGHHLSFNGQRIPYFDMPGVIVRSKTGTAQASVLFDDVNQNRRLDQGEKIIKEGSHSWYVAHVQREGDQRASYVVAVLVEYGGSGGRVAGPLINQILWMLRAEKYI